NPPRSPHCRGDLGTYPRNYRSRVPLEGVNQVAPFRESSQIHYQFIRSIWLPTIRKHAKHILSLSAGGLIFSALQRKGRTIRSSPAVEMHCYDWRTGSQRLVARD